MKAKSIQKTIPRPIRFPSFNEWAQAVFITPDSLKKKGIVVCDKCGRLCSVDYKYCSTCDEHILVTTKA